MHGKNNLVVVIVVALVVIVGAVVVFKSGIVSGQAFGIVGNENVPQGVSCYRYDRCAIGLGCRGVAGISRSVCLRPIGGAAPGSLCYHNSECGSNNCVGGGIWSDNDPRIQRIQLRAVSGTAGRCASTSGVVPQTGTASGAGGGRSSGRQTYRN